MPITKRVSRLANYLSNIYFNILYCNKLLKRRATELRSFCEEVSKGSGSSGTILYSHLDQFFNVWIPTQFQLGC